MTDVVYIPTQLGHEAYVTARAERCRQILAAGLEELCPRPARRELHPREPRPIRWQSLIRPGLPADQPQALPFAPLYTPDLREWEACLDELLDRSDWREAAE